MAEPGHSALIRGRSTHLAAVCIAGTLESDRYLNGYTTDNIFEGIKNLAAADKKLAEMFKNA